MIALGSSPRSDSIRRKLVYCCGLRCCKRPIRRRSSAISMSTECLKRLVVFVVVVFGSRVVGAQKTTGGTARDTTFATGITAGEADGEPRRRQLISAANLDLGFTTLRIGGGVLVDYIGYDQDTTSRAQFDNLVSIGKLRDARILTGGRFKKIKRPVTWQIGVMYDAATKKWL